MESQKILYNKMETINASLRAFFLQAKGRIHRGIGMPKIKIPASTANMGPGFDSLGMALTLYNEIEFTQMEEGLEIIVASSNDEIEIATDERNLIYCSIQEGLRATGVKMPGLRIVQTNHIPQTRGLGSSSACVVGGIIAANIISGGALSMDDMIAIATQIEGHPDNVLPTFVGGMAVAIMENEKVHYVRIDPPKALTCCVIIPDFPLLTAKARQVLPTEVSLSDAVFNVSHAGLMVALMQQGRLDLLTHALKDRLHQPYRKTLIEGYDDVVRAAEKNGALGCCLSGAGPTMIAFLEGEGSAFASRMKKSLQDMGLSWQVEQLDVCRSGATWETDEA